MFFNIIKNTAQPILLVNVVFFGGNSLLFFKRAQGDAPG